MDGRAAFRNNHFRMGNIKVSPARRAAFDILRRVEEEGAYASVLLSAMPEGSLSREDRSLAREITLGVLRWRGALDHFVEKYSRRRVDRIDPPVLLALRMGLYQIRHLTRIPHSAAVNESVNLVKLSGKASASGMANAVLRSASRGMEDRAGAGLSDPLEREAAELAHPQWMLERWQTMLGHRETSALALANNEPPPATFRVNTLRAGEGEALAALLSEGITAAPSGLIDGAFTVEQGALSASTRAVEDGLIYIQDEASQMVSRLLDPKSGERVLDLCAAPGSKSSHIAALTGGEALIAACDIHPHRLATLASTCRRLGAASVAPVALDATRNLPFHESAPPFDRVLIDAPCSGTGTLRRNPEIKWRLTPQDIERLADVQAELLSRGARAVAPGGRLVYSTCSVEPEENENVITRFIENGAPFRVVKPRAPEAVITLDKFVRTFPHRHNTDGFFAAVLERLCIDRP
ncbi:MAG TPA: 16S rRNA (cytosine(967)-C(5))-methyltransferase RsmB [Blastocatellia bacterium]|nr:16S rRNA (cytosine(967)-C(5))-methyltransferase RsmB [Blastocatellia bacterium]